MKRAKALVFSGLLAAAGIAWSSAAFALDIFTLWRQPDVPLNLKAGSWVDYRSQVLSGGQQDESLTRIVCLSDQDGGGDPEGREWVFEILPLDELEDGRLVPIAGEGSRLRMGPGLLSRKGDLLDAVISAEQWRKGVREELSAAQLRDDPLVAATLESDFQAETVARADSTTRVIADRQFLCEQLLLSAADTQQVDLPAGRMVQVTTREITAALNAELPLFGLAYISERIRAESSLDPPSRRMRPPPPRVRVEVMELVGFGDSAPASLPDPD